MELTANFYGKVELIPGIICDGYVLSDGITAVLSERGTADLLDMNQMALNRMMTKGLPKSLGTFCDKELSMMTKPINKRSDTLSNKGLAMKTDWHIKTLEPFIDNGLTMKTDLVEVTASNSPYQGRKIAVYRSNVIDNLIRSYALAFANDFLRENQKHIGKRAVILQSALVRTALDLAIKEACGVKAQVQKTARKNFAECSKMLVEAGFVFSLPNQMATKQDIVRFTKTNPHTLDYFLHKYSREIRPVRVDGKTLREAGFMGKRLNVYRTEDVVKIVFWMDSEKGVELKKRMFGDVGGYTMAKPKDEIGWRSVLSRIFAGFDLRYNHPIGRYRVDFFLPEFGIVLECNGDCHKNYDPEEEADRDRLISSQYCLIRFHNRISIENLVNAILKARPQTVVKLYDLEMAIEA